MTDESSMPRHLTSLGEALRPVCRKLESRLEAPTRRVEVLSDRPGLDDFLSFHLQQLLKAAHRLVAEINGALGDAASNEQAGQPEMYRAVGRIEVVIDELLAGYDQARLADVQEAGSESWTVGPDDSMALGEPTQASRALDLLARSYRHTLIEIRDWLAELLDSIADPVAALKKRGLPTSGTVKLRLDLELTAAPRSTNWDAGRSVKRKSSSVGHRGVPPIPKTGTPQSRWFHLSDRALGSGVRWARSRWGF